MSLTKGKPSTPDKRQHPWLEWLEERPLVTSFMSLGSIVIAGVLAVFLFSFHAEESGKIAGDRAGRAAATQEVVARFCPVADIYIHLTPTDPASPTSVANTAKVNLVWGNLATFIGCK